MLDLVLIHYRRAGFCYFLLKNSFVLEEFILLADYLYLVGVLFESLLECAISVLSLVLGCSPCSYAWSLFTRHSFSGVSNQCWGFSPRFLYSGWIGTPVSSQDSFLPCLPDSCFYLIISGYGQKTSGELLHGFWGLFFYGFFIFSTLPPNFSYCSRSELWSLFRLAGKDCWVPLLWTTVEEMPLREEVGVDEGFIPHIPSHKYCSPVLFTICCLESIISYSWAGFSL